VNGKTPGQVNYEAYRLATAGRSLITGDELPDWDRLPEDVQTAWQAGADAVIADR
jgi:hypothetical protein